ncbi:MAG: transporter, partial [Albidovulum sp.]
MMKTRGLASRVLLSAGAFALSLAFSAPARAETLADALVSAYKTSNLIEQNRAVLRATDEDVASAVARLRPVLEWVANVNLTDAPFRQDLSTSLALQGQVLLADFGRSKIDIEIA